jgi:hypothetical protein
VNYYYPTSKFDFSEDRIVQWAATILVQWSALLRVQSKQCTAIQDVRASID